MVTNKSRPYHVYVLRCWEVRTERAERPGVWRFCLKDPRSGKQHGFATLEALIAFLSAEIEAVAEQQEGRSDQPVTTIATPESGR